MSMTQDVFAVNGVFYNVLVTELQRNWTVLDNDENVGRTIDGGMRRDVIGTFYNYTLKIEPFQRDVDAYISMVDALTAPVDSVMLTVMRGTQQTTFEAYVTKGTDLYTCVDGRALFSGLSLNFVAMEPDRRP
jgi:hypothetical protein